MRFRHITNERSGNRNLLLCFHHVGGSFWDYIFLKELGDHSDVVLGELPMRLHGCDADVRRMNPVVLLEDISNFCREARQRYDRIDLFGVSMGSHIAHRALCHMERSGDHMVSSLSIASALAPDDYEKHDVTKYLTSPEYIAREFAINTRIASTGGNDRVKSAIIEMITFDYHLYEDLKDFPVHAVSVPIVGYFGESDPHITAESRAGWKHYSVNGYTETILRGGHFFERGEYPKIIADLRRKPGKDVL